jgi:hypothetical protein
MWVEACCCTGLAISGNRYLIQTRFDRMNTACDDCIIWTVCLASWFVCLANCFCEGCVPEEVENCVDCLIMTVDGCMLAQQQHELEYVRSNNLYNGPNQMVMSAMSPNQQNYMAQGKPPQQQGMGMGAGMAIGAGAMVAGAAGGAAAAGAFGGGKKPQGQPQGQPYGQPQGQPYGQPQGQYGQQPYGAPPGQMYGGPPQQYGQQQQFRGFMATAAPNGQSWGAFCTSQQAFVTPQGHVGGAWGECIAWSKIFECQNPGSLDDPQYSPGPTGQVIDYLVQSAPGHMAQKIQDAADRLEEACDQAAQSGRPFPLINARP